MIVTEEKPKTESPIVAEAEKILAEKPTPSKTIAETVTSWTMKKTDSPLISLKEMERLKAQLSESDFRTEFSMEYQTRAVSDFPSEPAGFSEKKRKEMIDRMAARMDRELNEKIMRVCALPKEALRSGGAAYSATAMMVQMPRRLLLWPSTLDAMCSPSRSRLLTR